MIRRDFYTGLFLLLAGGLLVAAYLYISLSRFSRNTEIYYADSTDVGGLQEGSDVEMEGYRLGTIKRIHLRHDPRLRFELELALPTEIPIPQGTRAVVTSRSLTGGRFLDLRPPAVGGARLRPKSHLVVETEPEWQDIIKKVDSAFANLVQITAELRQFVALEGDTAGLRSTFARLDRAVADADTTVRAANRLIERLDGTARQIAPSLESSAQALAGTVQNTESAARRFDALLEKQGPALEELLQQGNARLAELRDLSALLAGYDTEKNQTIRDTLKHLNAASKSLEELLSDVKRHPWKLIRVGKETPPPEPPRPGPIPAPGASAGAAGTER